MKRGIIENEHEMALWLLQKLQKYTLFGFYWGLMPPRDGRKWECVYFNPSGGRAQIFEGKTAMESCFNAYKNLIEIGRQPINDQT